MLRSLSFRITGLLVVLVWVLSAQDRGDQINALLTRYHETGQFNGAALGAENGAAILKSGYGLANMEWGIRNAPDTRFRIGSITKQFTAAIILQLVHEGKVNLNDPLSRFLPDYPSQTADKVTIHHLLNHTSGIPSYTGLPGFFDKLSRNPYSTADFIKTFSSLDLEFEPGTKYRYNNSGYFLLGAIIEAVTNDTYENALRKRIIEPLGLTGTGYDWHGALIPNRARGYESTLTGFRNAPYLDMSLPYAAGSMYSTVEDLLKWDQALYTETVLPAAMKSVMFKPNLENYAYGWVVRTVPHPDGKQELLVTEHGGGINGFNTLIFRVPETKFLIVLLNNTGGAPLQAIAENVRKILYGQPATMPKRRAAPVLLETYTAKDLAAALEQFSKGKAGNEQSVDWSSTELFRFGQHLQREKKTADAVTVMLRMTEEFPQDWHGYAGLGDARSAVSEPEAARKAYAKALELAPEAQAPAIVRKLKELYP